MSDWLWDLEESRHIRDQKIKVFGVGGCGNNVLGYIYSTQRMSLFALNTDICQLKLTINEKLDSMMLLGKKLLGGLGSGGNPEKGYLAAQETFGENLSLFDSNLVNIFIVGLGGGCGTGTTTYILEKIATNRKEWEKDESCNIAICIIPSEIERKRLPVAKQYLEEIRKYADLVFLIDMGFLFREMFKGKNYIELMTGVNLLAADALATLSAKSNKEIVFAVKRKVAEQEMSCQCPIINFNGMDSLDGLFTSDNCKKEI